MKFYSYANDNKNYVKAISLSDVRSLQKTTGTGKSQIRFGVKVNYFDGTCEQLGDLGEEESTKVYNEILNLLNKGV